MAQRPGRLPAPERPADRETEVARARRNFAELLQELRVTQAGVQILFAFLLILAFTPEFEVSEPFLRAVYLVALLAAAGATALLIGPVPYHRLVFQQRRKPMLVRVAHRMAFGGLALVAVSMVSAVLLAADSILGRGPAIVVSAVTGVWFLAVWLVLPVLGRRR